MRRSSIRSALRAALLSVAFFSALGLRVTRDEGLTPSLAFGEEWRQITTSAGPSPRRQEGLIVDPATDRLIVAGGENSDGRTWALDLAGAGNWVDLNAPVPAEASGVVRAVYNSQDRQMLLVAPSLTIYALDLTTPGALWKVFIESGTGPSERRYPAVAYDSKRNRLLLFGGGPGTGIYSDVWALDLGATPAWHELNPSSGPQARWAAVAVYDPVADRLVIGTGNNNGAKNDFWTLSLATPAAWEQITPPGDLAPRYLSAAGYAPGSNELVLFGGHTGASGLNDVWSLNLSAPESWRLHGFTTAVPAPVWSHAFAYDETRDELITYGGWDGSDNYRNEVWALPQAPQSTLPRITSFSPLGGRIGDEVQINGARLSSPTEVLIGGAPATVLSSTFGAIHAIVPVGAVTGPIQVTNESGTDISDRDFFVGELPEITSFAPDSSKAGGEVEIHGSHLASTVSVRFGGTGSAILGLIADDVVHVIVDSLASSGPIQLTTLVGTATSTVEFLVIVDDPRPRLLSVRDVRGDQGGKVLLRWRASDFDQPRYRQITGYRVWRRAPLTDAAASARPAPTPQGLPQIGPDVFWESIADLPAAFLNGYAFAASTLSDSSDAGNPHTAYFVQALSADPFVFYNSSPDSGYSVDDLAPPAPAPLTAQYGPSANAIHWHASGVVDLRGYELYRGSSTSFLPSPATLIATTTETSFTDVPGSHHYKLAAIDLHGNRSRFVAVAPDVPVGTLAAFVHSDRRRGHVQLTWFSGGNAGMQAHVQRRTENAGWLKLGTIAVDDSGFLRFDDVSGEDGVRYAYRLAILDIEGAEGSFTSESWVEPLAASRLSLVLGTNPSVGGRIPLALTLPGAAHASVSLFDLAGRELERRDVQSGGDGRVDLTLGASTRLRPGLYMIRATSGATTITRRIAVIL